MQSNLTAYDPFLQLTSLHSVCFIIIKKKNRKSCKVFTQRSETWHWCSKTNRNFVPVSAARDRANSNQPREGISALRARHEQIRRQSGYKAGAPMCSVCENVCVGVWWKIVCGCLLVSAWLSSLSLFLCISPPPLPLSPLPAALR